MKDEKEKGQIGETLIELAEIIASLAVLITLLALAVGLIYHFIAGPVIKQKDNMNEKIDQVLINNDIDPEMVHVSANSIMISGYTTYIGNKENIPTDDQVKEVIGVLTSELDSSYTDDIEYYIDGLGYAKIDNDYIANADVCEEYGYGYIVNMEFQSENTYAAKYCDGIEISKKQGLPSEFYTEYLKGDATYIKD